MNKFLHAILSIVLFAIPAHGEDKKIVLTKDNVLVMNTYFDSTSVARVAARAKELDSILPSKEPLFLVIDSGGGSIDAGIELIQNLNTLNRPIHTLTIFAASMGFHTVQGVNGLRLVTKTGTLMSHKARGGFSGEFPGQLDSRYSYYLKRVQNLDKGIVARTKGKHNAQSYASLIENEYWCDGDDCKKQGFIDYTVLATCDKSLAGNKAEIERFIFMGVPVEIHLVFAACPTITGILEVNVLMNGEKLFKTEKEGKEWQWGSNIEKLGKEGVTALQEKINDILAKRTNNSKRVILKY